MQNRVIIITLISAIILCGTGCGTKTAPAVIVDDSLVDVQSSTVQDDESNQQITVQSSEQASSESETVQNTDNAHDYFNLENLFDEIGKYTQSDTVSGNNNTVSGNSAQ